MSEYEIASLFYQVVEVAHAALANFLTVVFAVLVVCYFAAEKLDRTAWIILLGVYSLFAIGMTNEIVSLYSDIVRLVWQIANQFGTESTALSWHGMVAASANGPVWTILIIFGILGALFGGIFAGLGGM